MCDANLANAADRIFTRSSLPFKRGALQRPDPLWVAIAYRLSGAGGGNERLQLPEGYA